MFCYNGFGFNLDGSKIVYVVHSFSVCTIGFTVTLSPFLNPSYLSSPPKNEIVCRHLVSRSVVSRALTPGGDRIGFDENRNEVYGF